LVEPARPLGHLVSAHCLQPVNAFSEVRTTHSLMGPATDGLAQSTGEGGIARCRRPAQTFQDWSQIHSRAERPRRRVVASNCFAN
jgi:hypothetical protein